MSGTKMGFVFAARGIVPEACSAWFLPRIVGISTALEWCYSGRVFRAEEGLARGLLRSLHTHEELMPAARQLAREFADNSSAVSKALVRSIATLEDVVAHYARGGRNIESGPNFGDGFDSRYKSDFIRGFPNATAQQRADLIEFLKALADEQFLTNPKFGDPWQ